MRTIVDLVHRIWLMNREALRLNKPSTLTACLQVRPAAWRSARPDQHHDWPDPDVHSKVSQNWGELLGAPVVQRNYHLKVSRNFESFLWESRGKD